MPNETALPRRDFLRGLGTASTVTAAAALLPGTAPDAQAYNPGQNETRSRYQPDSPDVQAFYRTNGYETLKK